MGTVKAHPLPNRLSKQEWKSLWGILWRTLLLGPIIFPLGACLLALTVGFLLGPPFYAIILMLEGHPFAAVALVVTWFGLVRWARSVIKKVFDGIVYSGI
jgi:hypothetical protein